MANRILGIDLGTYSVKVSWYEASLRKANVLHYSELALSQSPPPTIAAPDLTSEAAAPSPTRAQPEQNAPAAAAGSSVVSREQLHVLKRLLSTQHFEADLVIMALPGDLASIRYLSFPFSDPRKISPVVGYELEGQIPMEIDEMVYDHLILPAHSGSSGERQTRVMVAAAQKERVSRMLQSTQSIGVNPQVITVPGLSYGYLAQDQESSETLMLVLDVGHRQTQLCLLRGGRPVFVRTLSRGGYHITQALTASHGISFSEAEQLKHMHAFLTESAEIMAEPVQRIVSSVRQAMRPWNIGLRQSLAAARTDLGQEIDRVVMCGGGSQLKGLDRHVAGLLGLPLASVKNVPFELTDGRGPQAVEVLGLCRLGADRRKDSVNLRQGELAAELSRSIFKEKALTFTAALVIALGLLVVNGWVKLRVLRKEQAMLDRELERQTERVLAKSIADPETALRRIKALRKKIGSGVLPVPKASAFAVLSEISRKAPPNKQITLDVKKLDIKSRKVVLKGTTASAGEVEKLANVLKEIKCFEKVEPGVTTEVGRDEEKKSEFTITIESNCM